MKNQLGDLNNYLFEQLERLNDDEGLQDEDNFKKEMDRSKAITSIGNTIINNYKLALDAKKYAAEYGLDEKKVLMLEG